MLFNRRFIIAFSIVSLAFIIGGCLWAYAMLAGITHSGTPLILHFNDLDGITQVGGIGTIIFMGVFGTLVTLMNLAIALEFDSRKPFFGKLVIILTLAFAILLFITFAAIINANV